jgi:hypothetical protein
MGFAVSLAACATPPPPVEMVWIRTDGQRIQGNTALYQQGEIDRTICEGEAQRANLTSLSPVETGRYTYGLDPNVEVQRRLASMDAIKGCMAQKGYLIAPADQADAMSAELAATAAQRHVAASPPQVTPKPKLKPPPPSPN